MDLSFLSDGMLGPLVGLGTAAAVYMGWILFHRLLPPALHMAHGLWILLSLGLGLLGWWLTPGEGRFAAEQVDAWQARRQQLAMRTEWRDLGAVWRDLSALSGQTSARVEEPPEVAREIALLEPRLAQALQGLAALERDGLLSARERTDLVDLAAARYGYVRLEAGPPREERSGNLWADHMATLEANRFRPLSRIVDNDPTSLFPWQQRVRLARELATLQQINQRVPGLEGLVYGETPNGPPFRTVPEDVRNLALLASDLSMDSAAACPISKDGCSPEQQKACDTLVEGASCSAPAQAPKPATGGCCSGG